MDGHKAALVLNGFLPERACYIAHRGVIIAEGWSEAPVKELNMPNNKAAAANRLLRRIRKELASALKSDDFALEYMEKKYEYDHKIGAALRSGLSKLSSCDGVIYGVYVNGIVVPVYIGESLDGRRRLYDLAIGESHHVANTFSTLIWDKVLVVGWRAPSNWEMIEEKILNLQAECSNTSSQPRQLSPLKVFSKAIEYHVREALDPLVGKRTKKGGQFVQAPTGDDSKAICVKVGDCVKDVSSPVIAEWKKLECSGVAVEGEGVLGVGDGFSVNVNLICRRTIGDK